MKDYSDIMPGICKIAETNKGIFAVVLFGSRTRTERPADAYSDYDLLIVVDEPSKYMRGDEWLKPAGPVRLSFRENGVDERRVFFDDSRDLDMIFVKNTGPDCITGVEIFRAFLSRGYKVLVDKMGIADTLRKSEPFIAKDAVMNADEFENNAQTFFFHILWAAKKALRGEIWSAARCVNGYLKDLTLPVLECVARERADTWHDGRFADEWISSDMRVLLADSCARYDGGDILRALVAALDLFSASCREAAQIRGFDYPAKAEEYTRKCLLELSGEYVN